MNKLLMDAITPVAEIIVGELPTLANVAGSNPDTKSRLILDTLDVMVGFIDLKLAEKFDAQNESGIRAFQKVQMANRSKLLNSLGIAEDEIRPTVKQLGIELGSAILMGGVMYVKARGQS